MSAPEWQKTQDQFYSSHEKHSHLHYRSSSLYARELAAQMACSLLLNRADRVLEIGCGAGRFTFHLSTFCGQVVALDTAAALLDALKKEAGPDSNLMPVCGDVFNLDAHVPESSLDAICGFFILHHLLDHERLFAGLRTRLKSGGRIGFIEPNRWNPLFLAQVLVSKEMTWAAEKGMFTFSAERTRGLLARLKFEQVTSQPIGFFPPQILDRFPRLLPFQRALDRIPACRPFLPFRLITAVKP